MVIVSAVIQVGVLVIETGVTMKTSVVVSTVAGKEDSIGDSLSALGVMVEVLCSGMGCAHRYSEVESWVTPVMLLSCSASER